MQSYAMHPQQAHIGRSSHCAVCVVLCCALLPSRLASARPDRAVELCSAELGVAETGLRRNPKCYSAWHHRLWVLSLGHSDLKQEMALCGVMLDLDARNCTRHNTALPTGHESVALDCTLSSRSLAPLSLLVCCGGVAVRLSPLLEPPARCGCSCICPTRGRIRLYNVRAAQHTAAHECATHGRVRERMRRECLTQLHCTARCRCPSLHRSVRAV